MEVVEHLFEFFGKSAAQDASKGLIDAGENAGKHVAEHGGEAAEEAAERASKAGKKPPKPKLKPSKISSVAKKAAAATAAAATVGVLGSGVLGKECEKLMGAKNCGFIEGPEKLVHEILGLPGQIAEGLIFVTAFTFVVGTTYIAHSIVGNTWVTVGTFGASTLVAVGVVNRND